MGSVMARLLWWRKSDQEEDAISDVSSSSAGSEMSASSVDGLISHEQGPRSSSQWTGKNHHTPIQKLPADLILRYSMCGHGLCYFCAINMCTLCLYG